MPSDPGGAHTTFAYDAAREVTGEVLPDGSRTALTYDGAGRLASVVTTTGAGSALAFAYTRDANGNVVAENAARYRYDALSRLTAWYDPSCDTTTTYGYDADYNLTTVTVGASVTTTFTYDAAERITSPGFAFDAKGDMTADGTHAYRYDALSRLTAVLDASGNTTIAAYTYDFENRRTSATDASGTTYFHYDGASPNVIAETDGAGTTIARYAYDAAGRIHSMTRGGATYYYLTNGHGDVVALTNASGAIADTYRYDPWGKVLAATETVPNPYRYAGYRWDGRTGLYYLWNRWYSPGTMRFLTRDPYPAHYGMPETPYGYCWDNPINRADLIGLFTFGAGLTGAAQAFGFGISGSVMLVGDDKGGLRPTISVGPQEGAIPSISGGVQLQGTGAPSAEDLAGWGGALGGSFPFGGAEGLTGTDRCGKRYYGANGQLLASPKLLLPFEFHTSQERTWVGPDILPRGDDFIFDPAIGLDTF